MTDKDPFFSYYERSTCSVQWIAFNRAFGAELGAGLRFEDIRQLFHRIGERAAQALSIGPCEDLNGLGARFAAAADGLPQIVLRPWRQDS